MSLHIIIDGYNLIYQSQEKISCQKTLEDKREKLIESLILYKKKRHHKITVIFDGTNSPPFLLEPVFSKGINIKFSQKGELADDLIKRICKKNKEKVVVVSSDNEIVHYANKQGSGVISSQDFSKKLIFTELENSDFCFNKFCDEDEEKIWQGHTKKKGASRKLSKKERRNRAKIKKL